MFSNGGSTSRKDGEHSHQNQLSTKIPGCFSCLFHRTAPDPNQMSTGMNSDGQADLEWNRKDTANNTSNNQTVWIGKALRGRGGEGGGGGGIGKVKDDPDLSGIMGSSQSTTRFRQQNYTSRSRSNSERDITKNDSSNHPNSHKLSDIQSLASPNPQTIPKHLILIAPNLSFRPADDVNILKLKIGIDRKLTCIDERSPAVLKYRTPHFRALAQVDVPALLEGDCIEVGWIQTCLHMQFINTYGAEGLTSWEFPEIISGKYQMVSDADGKQYPWYGAKHEVHKLQGPCVKHTLTIEMNDNFFPQVTWYIPDQSYDRNPRLTHIHRKQKFYTFLALRNIKTNQFHVLRTVMWQMELNIAVDPRLPQGKRAHLLEPTEQEPPRVLDKNFPIPSYALKPPNANNSQTLMWRPRVGNPAVIVPPVETTVIMDKYLLASRDLGRQYAGLERES